MMWQQLSPAMDDGVYWSYERRITIKHLQGGRKVKRWFLNFTIDEEKTNHNNYAHFSTPKSRWGNFLLNLFPISYTRSAAVTQPYR